jgi:hypothetical protein
MCAPDIRHKNGFLFPEAVSISVRLYHACVSLGCRLGGSLVLKTLLFLTNGLSAIKDMPLFGDALTLKRVYTAVLMQLFSI